MLALGHGQESDENVPRRLAFRGIGSIRVTQISGGGQHSAIIGTVSN
jgi:alpha-tubulin suppressor-like RCC1 family protein